MFTGQLSNVDVHFLDHLISPTMSFVTVVRLLLTILHGWYHGPQPEWLQGCPACGPWVCLQHGMAVNAAQHEIVNLIKTLWDFFCDYVSQCVSCVAQDNSSSSSVAQRHQKVGHPCELYYYTCSIIRGNIIMRKLKITASNVRTYSLRKILRKYILLK